MSEPVILEADKIMAGYVRGMPIVHDVSVTVSKGEIVTIIGPNGAGKSTFLKAIAGLIITEGGKVTYEGRDITGLKANDIIKAGIGFVPQTGNIFTTLTIHENLRVGGHLLSKNEIEQRMERTYAQFPALAQRKDQPGRVLSGGQRQMLAMGRAMMTDPKLILLDEPTAGLAPKIVNEVFEGLRELVKTGVAVLMVEQNAKAALRISDRGYVLAEGRNRASGPAQDLLADANLGRMFLGLTEASK